MLAPGAEPRHVMVLVLRQAAAMIAIGLMVGVVMTLLGAASLSKVLYGVASRDAGSIAFPVVAITLVAVLACVVPARRAMRVDPLRALRFR